MICLISPVALRFINSFINSGFPINSSLLTFSNSASNTCRSCPIAALSKPGVIDEISGARPFIALKFLFATAFSSEISSGIGDRISPPLSVFFLK